jgi:diguanylate cyclase
MAHPSLETLKRHVLLIILALSWTASALAWTLMELQGLASLPSRVFGVLNVTFLPVMALITWKKLVPLRFVDVSCLCFASGNIAAGMALHFYWGHYGAEIPLGAAFLWIPVIYVFAFTLPSRKWSLMVSLANLSLYLIISLPYLVQNFSEPTSSSHLTIQMHVASGVLIAALYFFSSYQQRFQLAQLTLDELARLANTDELTKLANRRRMTEVIEYERLRYARYGHPFSVIVFDIDHFKKVNDGFGHSVGDQILKNLAIRAGEVLREVDTLGRWGGEEFMVVLPETPFEEALKKANSLCAHVAAEPLFAQHVITLSCGVTSMTTGDTSSTLFERADVAVYAAKRRGRNRAEGVLEAPNEGVKLSRE